MSREYDLEDILAEYGDFSEEAAQPEEITGLPEDLTENTDLVESTLPDETAEDGEEDAGVALPAVRSVS